MKFDTIYKVKTIAEYRLGLVGEINYHISRPLYPVPSTEQIIKRAPNNPPRVLDLSKN